MFFSNGLPSGTCPGPVLYLAPFFDYNGDGDYQPTDGDYPGYDLDGAIDCKNKFREDPVPLFGDENIWWVFNDKGTPIRNRRSADRHGRSVRRRSPSARTDEVNNMTFYNYVLINQGTQTLLNTYFGQWVDVDLGCSDDDFVGCDVQRGLGYGYNGDNNDEGCNGLPGLWPAAACDRCDFFEGPFQDYDNIDNPLTTNIGDAVDSLGIPKRASVSAMAMVESTSASACAPSCTTTTTAVSPVTRPWPSSTTTTCVPSGRTIPRTCIYGTGHISDPTPTRTRRHSTCSLATATRLAGKCRQGPFKGRLDGGI